MNKITQTQTKSSHKRNPKNFSSNLFYVKSNASTQSPNYAQEDPKSTNCNTGSINDSSCIAQLNQLFSSSLKENNNLRNLRTLKSLKLLWDLAESIYSTKMSMSELVYKLYSVRHDVNEKMNMLKKRYGNDFDDFVQSRNKEAQLYIVAQIRTRNDKSHSN